VVNCSGACIDIESCYCTGVLCYLKILDPWCLVVTEGVGLVL